MSEFGSAQEGEEGGAEPIGREPALSVYELKSLKIAKIGDDGVRRYDDYLTGLDIQGLLGYVNATQDPYRLYVAHAKLSDRGIPPALREHKWNRDAQTNFVLWLTDLEWLMRRHPNHRPRNWRMRSLIDDYHKIDFYRFGGVNPERKIAEWHQLAADIFNRRAANGVYWRLLAERLDLSDEHCLELRTMMSANIQKTRARTLRRLSKYREMLYQYSLDHPDCSNTRTPKQIADDRTEILRLYLLSGKSATVTAAWLNVLHPLSPPKTRQAIHNQLGTIRRETRLKL